MSSRPKFDHARRRQIYQFVERNGAVDPETVRQNVQVSPQTGSKPARSGADMEPTMPMPSEEFTRHVARLQREGVLEERENRLRIRPSMETGPETLEVAGSEATVRPARQEDLSQIVDVIETVASEKTHVVASRLAAQLSSEGVLLRHNEREDRVFFVATVEETTVGWLHVDGEQFPEMDHTGELTLGVLDEYRGEGLGGTLMERGLDWARSQDYRKIYQNLPATNSGAVSFLEDQGWSVEATREGHYSVGGDPVDEVQLAIWLED